MLSHLKAKKVQPLRAIANLDSLKSQEEKQRTFAKNKAKKIKSNREKVKEMSDGTKNISFKAPNLFSILGAPTLYLLVVLKEDGFWGP